MPSLLLLAGTPGSGKTHLSVCWCKRFSTYKRISQDDLGSRVECEEQTRVYINNGFDVIVDRCNFNRSQRKVWLDLAKKLQVDINCIYLDIPIEVCRGRIMRRDHHPTQVQGHKGLGILEKFADNFEIPHKSEGFGIVIHLRHHQLQTRYTILYSNIPEKSVNLIIRLLDKAKSNQSQRNTSSISTLQSGVRDICQSQQMSNK